MYVNIKNILLDTKTPKILAVFLVLLLLLEWGLGIYEARQLDDKVESLAPPVVKKIEPIKQVKQHDAVGVNFFGEYVPHAVGDTGVERSKLNASIIGILYSSDEQASQVLMIIPGHADTVFSVGDTIPGGAVIKRITPEGILLMRSGIIESLSLPQQELRFAPPPQPMNMR